MSSFRRYVALVVVAATLSACSGIYSVIPRPVAKMLGVASILTAAVVITTDKTLEDHFVSYRTGKNCSTVRVEQGRTYCREDEPNPIPTVYCYQTLADVTCYGAPDPSRRPGDAIGNLQLGTL